MTVVHDHLFDLTFRLLAVVCISCDILSGYKQRQKKKKRIESPQSTAAFQGQVLSISSICAVASV